MKKSLATLIVCSFVAIAVLGAFTLHNGSGSHVRCIAETAAGTDCPVNNVFATANFLLNVFKSFSTANLVSTVFLVLGIALAFFDIPIAIRNICAKFYSLIREQNSTAHSFPIKFQLAGIRALYEKRDPFRLF